MSGEEGEGGGMQGDRAPDVVEGENKQLNPESVADSDPVKENGLHGGNTHSNYYHDEIVQMVQNEYMKSQDEGLKILLDSDLPDPQKVEEHDSRALDGDSNQPDPQKIDEHDLRDVDGDSNQPDPEKVEDSRDVDGDSNQPGPEKVEEHDSRAVDDDSDQPDLHKVQELDSSAGHDDSDQPHPQKVQDRDSGVGVDLKDLSEEIESLKRELLEERQTRYAAEEALKHLRSAHLEADTKAQELAAKLDEGSWHIHNLFYYTYGFVSPF